MVLVSPSLFNIEKNDLAERVKQVPNANYLHIDVTDGKFVKDADGGASLFWNELELEVVASNSKVPLDIHLMIANPLQHIERYARFRPEYISFHLEATSNSREVIKRIREYGVSPVIAINPDTPVINLNNVLKHVEMALLMSVVPGQGGQGYISEVTGKIAKLKRMIADRGLSTLIEVDGGIKLNNAGVPVGAGADVIVSGTGVFNHPQYAPNRVIELMKSGSYEK